MNRFRRTLTQLGWFNASLYALARALAAASGQRCRLYRYLFVAQQIAAQPICGKRGRDIEVRVLANADQTPADYPRPYAVVQSRYRQGALSLAAFRNGTLAGFLWLLPDAYQEDEVRVRYLLPCRQSVWDFDVWVSPEERLGWTFRRLWEGARVMLRARGVPWSCSRISAFNPASLRAHAAIGTQPLGSAIFLCCWRWQWMVASMPPYFHFSPTPASFPHLTIQPKEPPCHTSIKSV